MRRARRAGVKALVAVSYDRASWHVAALASRLDGVFAAYGLHPWATGGARPEGLDRDELERALDEPRAVAVGEIGLDFEVDGHDRAAQLEALGAQLEVALERHLPVVLHCRAAFEPLLGMIAEVGGGELRGVVHAYSRSPELARRVLDLGLDIGLGGVIASPRAKRARAAAAALPLDRIVLETDAPSIAIAGRRAADVEPQHVGEVARALAGLRGVDLDTIARSTTHNARELFRLPA